MRCGRAGGAGLLLDRLAGRLGVRGWLDDMAGLGLVHVGVNIGWCLRSDAEGRGTDGHREDINAEIHTNKKMSPPP